MGFTDQLSNAVESLTYNKDAAEAKNVSKGKAETLIAELRKIVFAFRDGLKNTDSMYFKTKVTELVDKTLVKLKESRGASEDDLKLDKAAVEEEYRILRNLNTKMHNVSSVPKYLRLLQEKKKPDEDASLYENIVDFSESIVADLLTVSSTELNTNLLQLQTKYEEIAPGAQLLDDAAKAGDLEKDVQKEKESERGEFRMGRLLQSIFSYTTSTVVSLFSFTLFLIAGTLASNDAVGRYWPYRILYFLYGGIFFPFTLLYYFYRYTKNDAPKIYAMIPLWVTIADTSIGRFFSHPFTYAKDVKAEKAFCSFLQKSAEIVGKTYEHKGPSHGEMMWYTALTGTVEAAATAAILSPLASIAALQLPSVGIASPLASIAALQLPTGGVASPLASITALQLPTAVGIASPLASIAALQLPFGGVASPLASITALQLPNGVGIASPLASIAALQLPSVGVASPLASIAALQLPSVGIASPLASIASLELPRGTSV